MWQTPTPIPPTTRFDVEYNQCDRLSDADLLLAPVLLNVRLSLGAFYGLQRIRPELEKALAHEDLQVPLRELDDPDRVATVVRPLYKVLDGTTGAGLSGERCSWSDTPS